MRRLLNLVSSTLTAKFATLDLAQPIVELHDKRLVLSGKAVQQKTTNGIREHMISETEAREAKFFSSFVIEKGFLPPTQFVMF